MDAKSDWALALALLGKFVKFNHQVTHGTAYLVTQASDDGLVELEGMSGRFAPHLFVVVEEAKKEPAE